ncbi:MAG: DUF4397 domain-containing protein [Adhaeribacter sp.]
MDKDTDMPEPQPTSIVSFYHGSPDAPDVDIRVDGVKLNTQPYQYKTFSNYVSFTPGTRRIKFNPLNSEVAYVDTALTFQKDKAYSLFLVDKLNQIDVLVLQDSLVTPEAGKSRVRFLNLSPDASSVDLATTGSTSSTWFGDVAFKEAIEFKEVNAGVYSMQVKSTGSGEVLLPVSNVDLAAGRIYTFVFRGFKTPPAGNTNGLDFQKLMAGY